MNQKKIGLYIKAKRKTLGLTQVELADKLGMSDKSVSKWERGVCMPDVSIYMLLCSVLGVTLNEFLAGEDIEAQQIEKKSEENLIGVTRDAKDSRRKHKAVIIVLCVILLAAFAALAGFAVKEEIFAGDYIRPVDMMKSNEGRILAGAGSAEGGKLYKYHVSRKYKSAYITINTAINGKKTDGAGVCGVTFEYNNPRGLIAVLPDLKNGVVKCYMTTEDGTMSSYDFDLGRKMFSKDSEMVAMSGLEECSVQSGVEYRLLELGMNSGEQFEGAIEDSDVYINITVRFSEEVQK